MPPTKGNPTNAVAERKPSALAPIVPQSVGELLALAEIYYKAGLCPKGCNRPEAIAAVIAAGLEIGLKPAAALNSMYLVNGKAALYGDAPLALVRASGLLESIEEGVEGSGMDRAGVCTMARKNDPAGKRTFRFSAADAKQANLWGKSGPWTTTPDRMLQLRARGWLLRDMFGDVLMGMAVAEDLEEAAPIRAEVTTPPAAPSPAGPPTDIHGEVMVGDGQLETIKKLMPTWVTVHGPNGGTQAEGVAAWRAMLGERFKVDTAKKLTEAQADELIATLRECEKSPTAAVFAPPTAAGTAPADQQQPQPTPTAA